MSARILAIALLLCTVFVLETSAQSESPPLLERPAPTASEAIAFDSLGRVALAGRLLTTSLNGSVDFPIRNVRLVIENRSSFFYTYAGGWVTFYDAAGIRCGEGLFKVDALAPGERAETDLPGMRLKCSPGSWRIVALNLVTRTDRTTETATQTTREILSEIPPLVISINGEEHPIQLNNPIVVETGNQSTTIILKSLR